MITQTRLDEVRQQILKQNDVVARALRARFHEAGVYAVSLVSSPGAGKTTFLEKTLARVGARHRAAALVGDLATDNDARRLAATRVPVQQITTGTACHLEAEMVEKALAGWDLAELDFLFIENVGNLVCPASYDLGEDLRLVLFSATEGEDKPLKYPTILHTADMAVITKFDLVEVAEFDLVAMRRHIQTVRPGMPITESTRFRICSSENNAEGAWTMGPIADTLSELIFPAIARRRSIASCRSLSPITLGGQTWGAWRTLLSAASGHIEEGLQFCCSRPGIASAAPPAVGCTVRSRTRII